MDLTEVALALREGKFTAGALLDQHLATIDRLEPRLNCFITIDDSMARKAAEASEKRYRDGAPLSMLDGIPVALKDNIDQAGLPTSNGTALSRIADDDAEVTARLREAGAVLLGKLNMDECALGATTDNPHHGATQNPWRHGYTPGGSSGGAGASVAAGLVMAALGTDTMGSVRLPAAYCGVVGLKPSKGLISTRGIVPLSCSLDNVGPLCRSVRDASQLLTVLAGEDRGDRGSVAPPAGWSATPQSRTDLSGLRIGLLNDDMAGTWADNVAAGFTEAQMAMKELGAILVPISPPDPDLDGLRREALLVIEAEAAHVLAEPLEKSPEAFSDDLKSMLAYGRNAPASRLERARHRLTQAEISTRQAFAEVDLIASPTAPQTAFPFDIPPPANQANLTALANISGCPAIALPCDLSSTGLPLSIQLMVPFCEESRLLGVAQVLESKWGRRFPPALDS